MIDLPGGVLICRHRTGQNKSPRPRGTCDWCARTLEARRLWPACQTDPTHRIDPYWFESHDRDTCPHCDRGLGVWINNLPDSARQAAYAELRQRKKPDRIGQKLNQLNQLDQIEQKLDLILAILADRGIVVP